jgi:hypothetical protein
VSSREDPEIALFDIADEHIPVRLHHGNSRLAVKDIGPLVRRMPMHLTKATGGEAHIHARNVLGGWQFALGDFVRPTTLFHALLHKIKRIPDGNEVAMIRWRRSIGVWIEPQESLEEWSCSAFCVLIFSWAFAAMPANAADASATELYPRKLRRVGCSCGTPSTV